MVLIARCEVGDEASYEGRNVLPFGVRPPVLPCEFWLKFRGGVGLYRCDGEYEARSVPEGDERGPGEDAEMETSDSKPPTASIENNSSDARRLPLVDEFGVDGTRDLETGVRIP